jgi:8-oxo-dGTP pyrophosphatase MutT (NUDIX family)
MKSHKTYKQPDQSQSVVDERSAGAVVFYFESDSAEPEYLLLNYTAGHWDFPKGNIEHGEQEKEAATREIREETGITDVEYLEGFRMKIDYRYRHGKRLVHKEVLLFLARTKTKQVVISHEHIGFAWKKYENAMEQLTYRNAKNLLQAARDFLRQQSIAYGG